MESKDYLKDISEIKDLMNKSSRFISLSGLSGILAGMYALIGAAIAYWLVTNHSNGTLTLHGWVFQSCLITLILVAMVSIITAIILTTKKAKKHQAKIWDATSKRLVINFLIPLVVGGLYILIILSQGKYEQSGGLMLIFYGLALVNASKYSIGDIRYLGYIQIILGLLASWKPGYGFWLWVIGFGIMHIVYGTWTITKRLKYLVLLVTTILLLPLISMQFTNEVNWSLLDFIVAGFLLFGTVLAIELVLQKVNKKNIKLLLILGILAAIILIWVELAVGIFGTPLAGS